MRFASSFIALAQVAGNVDAEIGRNIFSMCKRFGRAVQMARKMKKNSMARGMTYGECVSACIAAATEDQADDVVAIYKALPIPSDAQWAECLQDVAQEPSEDVGNPYHCMGVYELRLAKRGIPTVLGIKARRVSKDLDNAAIKAGIPVEFRSDVVRLSIELRGSEHARNKKLDP